MALPPLDPAKRQKLLLGVLMIVGFAYAAHNLVLQPRSTEAAELESRVEKLRLDNQRARALVRGEGSTDVERRLAAYREQLTGVEGLIPSAEELPDLLDAISAEAQRTGVQLSLIQPVDATQERYYTRRAYDVAVIGRYDNIGRFLTRVASLPRIVTPLDLSLSTVASDTTRDVSPRLEARFSIETYVLTPTGGDDEVR